MGDSRSLDYSSLNLIPDALGSSKKQGQCAKSFGILCEAQSPTAKPLCVYTYTKVCIYIYVHVHTCSVRMNVRMHAHRYICVYIYIHIHVLNVYRYVYIYMYDVYTHICVNIVLYT